MRNANNGIKVVTNKMNKQIFCRLLMGIIFLCLLSCTNRVIVTVDSVFSTSWKQSGYQGFEISKILPLDPRGSFTNSDFNKFALDSFLLDSVSCFHVMSKPASKDRSTPILLNKPNDFVKWYPCFERSIGKDTFGKLENMSWYRISKLYQNQVFYVYVDSLGDTHTFV